jgi:hypothetical protein
MARKIKPSIFRFTTKNSNKIFGIGKSADFAHLYDWLKYVCLIFVENV